MTRRNIYIFLNVLFVILTVAGPCPEAGAGTAFVPSRGRVLVIGQQKDSMEIYIKEFEAVPAGFMLYTSIQELDGLECPDDKGAGVGHGQYWVDTYPETVLQVGLYMVDALPGILAGNYDDHITQLGEWVRKTRRPVYLRVGYEFDNKENRYDPASYQEAFRYIVKMFRKQGVTNAAFVWHSMASFEAGMNLMDWYPGDAYVDWFGISFFSTQQSRAVEAFCHLARGHGKPVMIAEAAPAGLYTARGKMDWLRRFFDLIEKEDIQFVSYINSDWDRLPMFAPMRWGNSRLHGTAELREYWLSRVREAGCLVSSPELFGILGFPATGAE